MNTYTNVINGSEFASVIITEDAAIMWDAWMREESDAIGTDWAGDVLGQYNNGITTAVMAAGLDDSDAYERAAAVVVDAVKGGNLPKDEEIRAAIYGK